MHKDNLERMCRTAGMTPELRDETPHGDIYIADGFAANADIYRRFGGSAGEFPFGCFCALWSVANGEDRVIGGGALLFDAFHDPGWTPETKKRARLNTAMQEAHAFLAQRERVRADAEPV